MPRKKPMMLCMYVDVGYVLTFVLKKQWSHPCAMPATSGLGQALGGCFSGSSVERPALCIGRFKRLSRNARRGLLISVMLFLAGCDTLAFYHQATIGQWQVLRQRQPVADVLAQAPRNEAEVRLHSQLQLSQQLIEFASTEIGIEVGKRYLSYVDLDREYVVWSVFAADPYNLNAQQWCYPFVGCAPYRGYFAKRDAQRAARRLAARGLDTYLGPVPAYSTLGWFDDPLLSSFIHWPEAELANLLLHELAHSEVWVKGDVAFNESFASFVGGQAALQWFARDGREAQHAAHVARRAQWLRFRDFALDAKAYLLDVHAKSPETSDSQVQSERRDRAYAVIRSCYQTHKSRLGGGRFDALMADEFNSAYLVSLSTYANWQPAFAQIFAQTGEDWPAFFAATMELADLPPEVRQSRMTTLKARRLADEPIHTGTDDQDADQVDCEAFADHGLHGETPG